jgi:hypothetical protein
MHCALIVEDETITRSILARVVSTPGGSPIGDIVMLEGRVWSAQTRDAAGSQALRELVARLDARVRLEAVSEKLDPSNVNRNWQVAVADAMMLEPDAIAAELAKRATSSSARTSSNIR